MNSSEKKVTSCDKTTQYEEQTTSDSDDNTANAETLEAHVPQQSTGLSFSGLVDKAQDVGKKAVDTVVHSVKNPSETYHTVVGTGKQVFSTARDYVTDKFDMFKKCLVTNKETEKK